MWCLLVSSMWRLQNKILLSDLKCIAGCRKGLWQHTMKKHGSFLSIRQLCVSYRLVMAAVNLATSSNRYSLTSETVYYMCWFNVTNICLIDLWCWDFILGFSDQKVCYKHLGGCFPLLSIGHMWCQSWIKEFWFLLPCNAISGLPSFSRAITATAPWWPVKIA